MSSDPYQELGIHPNASAAEIKAAYRELVKRHHPDTGGDEEKMLSINAAWEILRDPQNRQAYDNSINNDCSIVQEAKERGIRNARASVAARAAKGRSAGEDDLLLRWLNTVYTPIDRLLGEVIKPFPSQIKALSADPYDDLLMQDFCNYLHKSRSHLNKVANLYRSMPIPNSLNGFGLSLYHCLSQIEDAISELERYTMGYVDNYLHDGQEMMRKAKQKRKLLHLERQKLQIQ